MLRDDLVEALLQRQELGLDAAQEAPVDVEADVLLLGVLRDREALPAGLQLVLDDLAVGVVLHAEGVVQHARDVVLPGGGAGGGGAGRGGASAASVISSSKQSVFLN